MVNSLLLLPAEQTAFGKLPEGLRADWKVVKETGTRFETPYELMVRAGMMEMETFPQLKKFVADLKKGKKMDVKALKEIPQEALPEVFFTIGAIGMTKLIASIFPRIKTDEDISFIAALSMLRHDILMANASIASK